MCEFTVQVAPFKHWSLHSLTSLQKFQNFIQLSLRKVKICNYCIYRMPKMLLLRLDQNYIEYTQQCPNNRPYKL